MSKRQSQFGPTTPVSTVTAAAARLARNPAMSLAACYNTMAIPLPACYNTTMLPAPAISRRPYRILEHRILEIVRTGELTVKRGRSRLTFHGSIPHDVYFELRQRDVNGFQGIHLFVVDETAGNPALYTLDERSTTTSMLTPAGRLRFKVDPEGTVVMGGRTYATLEDAIHESAPAGLEHTITVENLAVMLRVVTSERMQDTSIRHA